MILCQKITQETQLKQAGSTREYTLSAKAENNKPKFVTSCKVSQGVSFLIQLLMYNQSIEFHTDHNQAIFMK